MYNSADGTVEFQGKTVPLSKNESRILGVLLRHKGETVSRETLMNALWETDCFVDENTLTVNVTRLRRPLESIGAPDVIPDQKGRRVSDFMKRKLFGTALWGYLREKSGWLPGFLGFIACFSLIGWACGLPGSVALYGASCAARGCWQDALSASGDTCGGFVCFGSWTRCGTPPSCRGPAPRSKRSTTGCCGSCTGKRPSCSRKSRQSSRRQLDTFSLWTHQIKVPISAMKLLLQDRPDAASATLLCELFKVEQYADMALNYARMNASSTDYVLRACDLDALLRKVLRRFAPLFIQKKLRLCYEPVSYSLLTDEKWFSFAVEQLLSNAVKYTKAGSVTVAVDAEKQLFDHFRHRHRHCPGGPAPGIRAGLHQQTGREQQRATGLGLYLCREALTRLGHSVRLESTHRAGNHGVCGAGAGRTGV